MARRRIFSFPAEDVEGMPILGSGGGFVIVTGEDFEVDSLYLSSIAIFQFSLPSIEWNRVELNCDTIAIAIAIAIAIVVVGNVLLLAARFAGFFLLFFAAADASRARARSPLCST